MILNDDKIKKDMFNEIVLADCPELFKSVAENIIRILNITKSPSYNKMSELDKKLTLMYWEEIDSLSLYNTNLGDFEQWYVDRATNPDIISRARRWLVENRYIIVKTDVAVAARESSEKWRNKVKGNV